MKLLQVRVDPCGLTAQPFLVKLLTATTHMEMRLAQRTGRTGGEAGVS